MTSVDKAAVAWSIAIVAVGAGFAIASQSFDIGISPAPAPTPSITDEKIEAARQQIEMEQAQKLEEERAKAIEEQKAIVEMEEKKAMVELEEELAVSEETMKEEVSQPTGPMTVAVSMPAGTSVPGCEETNECYIPASVSINVGDTVIWANDDTAAHTVTSGSPTDGPDGIFDSSLVMAGATFEVTFDESGSYDYFCMVHPWMQGNVQVS